MYNDVKPLEHQRLSIGLDKQSSTGMLNITDGTSASLQLSKLDHQRPGACSRCKTAPTHEFPCVKRAPSRQLSSKSDRTGLRETAPTPYRLPRLLSVSQPSLGLSIDRYKDSHDKFKIRSDTFEKFLKSRRKPFGPPNTTAQKIRSDNIHLPSFQVAEFLPVETPRPKTQPELIVARFNSTPTQTPHTPRYTPRKDGFIRTQTASESDRLVGLHTGSNSVWRLSPYHHGNYDNQVIGGGAGPYSRGFKVHCNTPKSWLQMKWSRERTSL